MHKKIQSSRIFFLVMQFLFFSLAIVFLSHAKKKLVMQYLQSCAYFVAFTIVPQKNENHRRFASTEAKMFKRTIWFFFLRQFLSKLSTLMTLQKKKLNLHFLIHREVVIKILQIKLFHQLFLRVLKKKYF
jgi:hypothetical protein